MSREAVIREDVTDISCKLNELYFSGCIYYIISCYMLMSYNNFYGHSLTGLIGLQKMHG